jgi:hypothetical protein
MIVSRRYSIGELIGMIDETNRAACQRIYEENPDLFAAAPGSSNNHQAWEGGYQDHVTEVMNLYILFYHALESTERLPYLHPGDQFDFADGLVVMFVHDIEKLRAYVVENGRLVLQEDGRPMARPEYVSKVERHRLAESMLEEYGIVFTPAQANAYKYVEGIRDADYTPKDRLMSCLAALCHMSDLASARFFYNFPRAQGDPWANQNL